MPLAFDSLSHGKIAFGFFNIDSDMLLLENYFFFATEFCRYVSEIAEMDSEGRFKTLWLVYCIVDPKDIGDLMGAIHGIHYTGFIGELYRRFPFPKREEDFKQSPEGFRSQGLVKEIIAKYARRIQIPFIVNEEFSEIGIGEYRFTRASFQELIKYVWRGGYPRWKEEARPDYVRSLKRKIELGKVGLFEHIVFDD